MLCFINKENSIITVICELTVKFRQKNVAKECSYLLWNMFGSVSAWFTI